jgi:hypothetical protein
MTVRSAQNLLFTLAAIAAIGVPMYFVVRTIADARPLGGPFVPPTAVVWGDRVFSSQPPLAVWLHRRGVAYSVWAERHPPASQVLAH